MPRPEPRDAADLLLRKASSDLAAVRALADDRGAAVQAAADAIEWAHGFVRPTASDSP